MLGKASKLVREKKAMAMEVHIKTAYNKSLSKYFQFLAGRESLEQ